MVNLYVESYSRLGNVLFAQVASCSASALYVQCGLNLLPHFFGPALFPLVTWLWPPNRSACLKFNPFPSSHGVINTRFAKHTFCWKYSNFSHQLKVSFELKHAQVFGNSVFITFLYFSCSFKASLSGFRFNLSAIAHASAQHQGLGPISAIFVFTCSLDSTNIKITGTFRLLNEFFLSFSLALYNVDYLLVNFCAIWRKFMHIGRTPCLTEIVRCGVNIRFWKST